MEPISFIMENGVQRYPPVTFLNSPLSKSDIQGGCGGQLYPEYYILKVNDFNRVARSPLEEWIYYLNTGERYLLQLQLSLEEARERLKLDSMTKDGNLLRITATWITLNRFVTISIPNVKKEELKRGKAEGRAEEQS